jgi:hypothetical protein
MKRILISLATTFVATTLLVACNGSGNNASDVTSEGIPLSKAVCTSSKNWKEVGIGMTAGQVEERLGKPNSITSNAQSTTYVYENCRGFATKTADAVPAVPATATSAGTPRVPLKFSTVVVGGSVIISGGKGVTAFATPPQEKTFGCELDFFSYPDVLSLGNNQDGDPIVNCRATNNPF